MDGGQREFRVLFLASAEGAAAAAAAMQTRAGTWPGFSRRFLTTRTRVCFSAAAPKCRMRWGRRQAVQKFSFYIKKQPPAGPPPSPPVRASSEREGGGCAKFLAEEGDASEGRPPLRWRNSTFDCVVSERRTSPTARVSRLPAKARGREESSVSAEGGRRRPPPRRNASGKAGAAAAAPAFVAGCPCLSPPDCAAPAPAERVSNTCAREAAAVVGVKK